MNAAFRSLWIVSLIGVTLVACRPSERDTSESGDTARRADTASGMAGVQGMRGGMSTAMMDSMGAHMRMMDTMSAEQMKATLPSHRQMVANMLSQMNQEMRNMNMSGGAAWAALADSVRQDLVRLPEMSASELRNAMPAHRARVTRLMEQHREMMRAMGH
jgi:hypothetical protein